MRHLLFILAILAFFNCKAQDTQNVSFQKVVSFRGSFTTTERNLLDVPTGDVWMIYNSTTGLLEFARADDVWSPVGGGAADNLGADVDRSLFTVSGGGTAATLNLNTVDSTHIKPLSIQSEDIANNEITTLKILNGTIVAEDIANETINSGKVLNASLLPADLKAINSPQDGWVYSYDLATGEFEWVNPSTLGAATSLIDLTDVSGAAQAAGNVLVSNGTTFSARPLLEVDISNLSHTVNTDNQNARQVPILDSESVFDSITVEGALYEIRELVTATGSTDDQVIDVAQLVGTDLQLSLENDGEATKIIDLSSLQDGTGTDDQDATEVSTITTNFDNNLSPTEDTVQKALDVLDELSGGGESTTVSDTAEIDLTLTGSDITADIVLGSIDETKLDTSTNASLDLADSALQAEVDGSTSNELQTIDVSQLVGTDLQLSLSNDGEATKVIDLSPIQDGTGTDDQDLTLVGNTLAIENDPNTDVDLSPYLDNTDSQTLSLVGTNLTISNGNTQDLASLQDGTGTDDQNISGSGLAGTNLTIGIEGGTNEVVDLAPLQDGTGTDDQTLSLVTNTLSIESGNSVDLSGYLDNTDTQLTDEQVEDIVGAMVTTTNTETLIDVTYQDTTGDMDFAVNDDLSLYDNTTSNFSTGAHTVDTDTNLTQEEVQDFVGPMVAGNTETLINVTYDDGANEFDFVVENDLSLYDNTTSGFLTSAGLSGYLRSDVADQKTSGNLTMNDNINLAFGTGNDHTMSYNGLNTYFDMNTAGDFIFRNGADEQVRIDDASGLTTYRGNIRVEGGQPTFTNELLDNPLVTMTIKTESPTYNSPGGQIQYDDNSGFWFRNQTSLDGLFVADNGNFQFYDQSVTTFYDILHTGNVATAGNFFLRERGTSNVLSSTTDLNSGGIGAWYATTGTPNRPAGINSFIIGLDIGGFAYQIGARDDQFYMRTEESSTWDSWRELWHDGKSNTTAGQITVNGNEVNIAGTSPRVDFDESGESNSWNILADAGNLDFRRTNTTNTELRLTSSGNTDVTGLLTVKGGSNAFRLWGNSTGNSNIVFQSFYENNGTTRQGYIGIGSSGNDDMYLTSDTGNLRLNSSSDILVTDNGVTYNMVGASGNRHTNIPGISSSGVMEIGRYIDFHRTAASTVDNDGRLDMISTSELRWSTPQTTDVISVYNSANEYARFGANTSGGYIQATDDAGGTVTTIRGYGDSDFKYGIDIEVNTASTNKDTGALVIEAGGLGVEGEIHAGGDIEAFNASDPRLKQDIKRIKNPLDKIDKLGGYTYKWKPFVEMMNGKKGKDYGVLSTEVEKVMPEAVRESTHGYDQVQYIKLVPLLIEGMKEQQEIIDSQEKRLADLEKKLKKLEKALK